MRFQLKAGEPPPKVMDISGHFGENALLMGNIPDYVMLPEQLGGSRANITNSGWWDSRCPHPTCQASGPVFVMITDHEFDGGTIAVVCCSTCEQYIWIRWVDERRNDQEDETEGVRGDEPGDV